MNDEQFYLMSQAVSKLLKPTGIEKEIERLSKQIKFEPGDPACLIESNVWGWSILYPKIGFGMILCGGHYAGGFSILAEGIATLDDAITVCDALGATYRVRDWQDPDPL